MKQNKTELILLIDRSGSMSNIKSDMEGGLKSLIEKQKLEKGECLVTFYQFDTQFEKVFEAREVKEVEKLEIIPRGGTALFDALGKAINEVGGRLRATQESLRPESLVFICITDGQENSSHEFSNEQIKGMIDHQEKNYNWKFIYLGANQDAFTAGQGYGFKGGTSVTYATSRNGINNTFDMLSNKLSAVRSCSATDMSYSAAERVAAQEK